MKKRFMFLLALGLLTVTTSLRAQGTVFTYQGQLRSSGNPANGNYDFTFALFNTNLTNGIQLGNTQTNFDVGVTNGLFTVALDFGSVFTGNATWLAIGVRSNSSGAAFTALNPLQELTPTPYALYAEGANAAGLTGSISISNIANGSITSNLLAAGAVGSSQIASGIGLWSQSGSSVYYNNGSVGIGTNAPTGPLQVVGNIQMGIGGANYAASSPENLLLVRGTINPNGTIYTGSGFTCAHNGTGQYTLTFTNFAAIPTVTFSGASCIATWTGGTYSSSGTATVTVAVVTYGGTAQDQYFNFMAVAPPN